MFVNCKSEGEWLANRFNYLTASDASNYMGVNPYAPMGKLELWEEKIGLKKRKDISDKPSVKFGKTAEEHIRALFMLRHPEYELQYDQFGLFVSDEHPFMASTLDGLLLNKGTNTHEILEIKTGTVRTKEAWLDWVSGDLPINYYCQILHQSACLPWAVGIWVTGLIATDWEDTQQHLFTFHFDTADEDFLADRKRLIECAETMWKSIKERRRPHITVSL